MRVAGHDVDVVELFEQVAHGLAVERRGVAQRNMHAEDDELLLRDEAQILPQPLDLRIGETPFVVRGVVFLVRQQDVVHGDDVGVAPVERVVARAELVFEVAASGQIEVAALVGDGGRHAVVVVAHHLKEFQSDLAFAHGQCDGRHHLVGDVFAPLVEDDVTQRNAVDGTFERRDMRADIGHGLLLETGQIRVFLYLRIGDADQLAAIAYPQAQQGQKGLFRRCQSKLTHLVTRRARCLYPFVPTPSGNVPDIRQRADFFH